MDIQFAVELRKIPSKYHEIAADLYEQLHQRAKFAKLTSAERRAIYDLCCTHREEDVLEVLAAPASHRHQL